MGTNYYLEEKPPCESCGRPFERLHIGKSSAGWVFALHVIPGEIDSLKDWQLRWVKPGVRIVDEYGRQFSPEDMLLIITARLRGDDRLMRSVPGKGHCVGHGDGTWDLIDGEFS